MKWTIDNWSAGQNNLYDPRQLQPNQPGEPAEGVLYENMEITSRGSIITSNGFELVSSGSGNGVLNILPYEKDTTDKYLLLATDDDYSYITPSNTTWQAVGDYGDTATLLGGVVYKGTSSTRRAILGNNVSANTTKKWDGTTFANLGGSPPDGWIMESFQGRLFIAGLNSATLYYCDVEDEDDWAGGGTISLPDIITGLKAQGEFLQVHTRRESFTVQFYYNDSFSLSAPLLKPYKNASGCLAHKSIVPVYNDTYHLSQDGIQKFGADPNYLNQPIRANSLSWKIDPALFQKNLSMSSIQLACSTFFEKKFMCSIPYGNDTYPSRTFQYSWTYDAWTTRTGFFPNGYAVFPDSNGRDQLYFASALSPSLYKFNRFWSYDGAGYTKNWTSKVFTFGSSDIQKHFNYIDIAGAMLSNTTFYVDVTVDGTTVTYKVDSSNLLQSSSGGYYGDNYYGDTYGGGGSSSEFLRFGARLPMTFAITEGREIQISIRNNAAGEPFAIDFLQFDFEPLDSVQIPTAVQVDEIV